METIKKEKIELKKFVFNLPAEWGAGEIVLWAVDKGTALQMFKRMYWTTGKRKALFLGNK